MVFQITDSLCTRCGICVEVCPTRVIEMIGDASLPTPTSDAEERCINCGHCVSVCPDGALSLDRMPVDRCMPVREEWFPEPDHLEHFFRARRSIRCFTDESLDRGTLTKLIELARHAPTGSNSQQVGWVVVHEREKVEAIAGMTIDYLLSQAHKDPSSANAASIQRIAAKANAGYDYICRGAPHLILAHAPESRGPTDSVIALTYLEIAAFSLGLGPCWGGYVGAAAGNSPALRDFLKIPQGRKVFGAMLLGRPKYRYLRLPVRNAAQVTWVE